MIIFENISAEAPYKRFENYYNNAEKNNQNYIEAISISSFSKEHNEVNSRYVNLKYIKGNEWIFFSNYDSPKSNEFKEHDQICATFFWNQINVQIRIKAKIKLMKISQTYTIPNVLKKKIFWHTVQINQK